MKDNEQPKRVDNEEAGKQPPEPAFYELQDFYDTYNNWSLAYQNGIEYQWFSEQWGWVAMEAFRTIASGDKEAQEIAQVCLSLMEMLIYKAKDHFEAEEEDGNSE
jgi:hypothetical protein